jgi:hypothetical protein
MGALGAIGRSGSVPRVEAIPSLKGREDVDQAAGLPADEKDEKRERSRLIAQDPRAAASIVSEPSAEKVAGRADARRLAELLGEKAGIESKRAQARGERSAEVMSQLAQLRSRDSEVRAHEAAHMAAGGRYVTGGASYSYQRGPDGGQYAVGGEVGIDTSSVPGKPEETVQKMRTIRAAALAPSDPSAADISVAAAAAQAEAAALAEIAQASRDRIVGTEEAAVRYEKEGSAGAAPARNNPLDIAA